MPAASANVQVELANLQKRYDAVKAQLKELGDKADDKAASLRKEAKTAADDLKRDLDRFADRLRK